MSLQYRGTHDLDSATVSLPPSVTGYDATVGPSGDYTTLKAAVDDSKTNILVTGNTTETANIAIPVGGFSVTISADATVDMDTFNFTASTNKTFWYGPGTLSSSRTTGRLFSTGFTNLLIDGLIIDETGTTATGSGTEFTQGQDLDINNVTWMVKNATHTLLLSGFGALCKLDNILFTDGGASADSIIVSNGEYILRNLIVNCTYTTSATVMDLVGGIVENVYNNPPASGTGTYRFNTSADVHVTNLRDRSVGVDLDLDGGLTGTFVNCDILEIDNGSAGNEVTLIGCDRIQTFTATANFENYQFIGCTFFTNLSYPGDASLFSGCQFVNANSLTLPSGSILNNVVGCNIEGGVSITGNDNTISACKVGPDAGGGGTTVTVNSGANRTIITGTRTDGAISDSGTGTVTAGNAVY